MPEYFDNTRVSTYRDCPRKFFFRHVMDIRPSGIAPPLVFGGAWHEAMDVVWPAMCEDPQHPTDNLVKKAMLAFLEKWEGEGAPSMDNWDESADKKYKFRSPMTAMEMLWNYIEEYREKFAQRELIAVEKPFVVPLDPNNPDLFYVGRLDKVYRDKQDNRVYIGEHKTSSSFKKDGPFRMDFIESFDLSSQVDGYNFAARSLYGEDFKCTYIDAALVHKIHHDGFRLIRVDTHPDKLDTWLWETHDWISRIQEENRDFDGIMLSENEEVPIHHQRYMPAFPKNTGSCSHFTGCSYSELCRASANPLIWTSTPDGYVQDHWSPFERLELAQLGLDPEDG